jgi:hypothetical protein
MAASGTWQVQSVGQYPEGDVRSLDGCQNGRYVYTLRYDNYVHHLWRFDLETQTWLRLADPWDSNGSTVYNGNLDFMVYDNILNKIYLYGVQTNNTGSWSGRPWDAWMSYDVSANAWSGAFTNFNSQTLGAASYQPFKGGYYYNGKSYFFNSYEVFEHDIQSNTFSKIYTFISGDVWNNAPTLVGIMNKLYFVGGSVGAGTQTFGVYCLTVGGSVTYDKTTTSCRSLFSPDSYYMYFANCCIRGSSIVVMGSYAESPNHLAILEYDVNTKIWTRSSINLPLPVNPTSYPTPCVSYKGRVYRISGLQTTGTIYMYSFFPQLPSNVKTIFNSPASSITLTWDDNASDETSYVIERMRSDQDSFTQVSGVLPAITNPPGTGSFVDSPVDFDNFSYIYRIIVRKSI